MIILSTPQQYARVAAEGLYIYIDTCIHIYKYQSSSDTIPHTRTNTHSQTHTEKSRIESEFHLQIEEVQLPRGPAGSREEHEEMCALWPMTYHGVVEVIKKEEAALTE